MSGGVVKMLRDALIHSLIQIEVILDNLQHYAEGKADQYFAELGVGRHLRHIYDHFLAVQMGTSTSSEGALALIDYNRRNRESLIEVNRHASRDLLQDILLWCQSLPIDDAALKTRMMVISEIDCLQQASERFETTFARELLYLINHTIHHVAYVKLLLKQVNVSLPESIGIAPSTASYERANKKMSVA
jgi:uncharacterized damage-inducible protein DinB